MMQKKIIATVNIEIDEQDIIDKVTHDIKKTIALSIKNSIPNIVRQYLDNRLRETIEVYGESDFLNTVRDIIDKNVKSKTEHYLYSKNFIDDYIPVLINMIERYKQKQAKT